MSSIMNRLTADLIPSIILSICVGYGFYYMLTQFYPQYSDNYLVLGIVAVVWILFVSISTSFAQKFKK